LVPKEAPKFDYPAHELVIFHSNKLPVEGVHTRANKLRGLALEGGDGPGWGIGHDALYVAFHELIQVLYWYPKGLAVEERQDVDVECAPRVVSRGAGGEAGWSDRICGNESGRGCSHIEAHIEALGIVRKVGEVSEAVHFARDQL
jgi:hypothetical protein